jgi:NAD(P)-dependent dehydrogenase (short-subunit alcohol dehydrogenase family)
MSRTAVVAGATGLVGGELVRALAEDPSYERVIALARRPLAPAPKLETLVVDFDHLDRTPFTAADAFCALGTTIKKAGSKEAFRKVDFDYALAFARAAKASCQSFGLVSALGANAKSSIFYNQVKGEGDRGERRIGEKIGTGFASVVGALPFGATRRLKPVPARLVARALIALARERAPGTRVVESESIPAVAG